MSLHGFLTTPRFIRFTYAGLLFALVALAIIAYISWEAYWYSKVGLPFIKWHTHIFFTTVLFGLFWLPFFLVYRHRPTGLRQNMLLSATSVWFIIVLMEVVLIATGANKVYLEIRSGYYRSLYSNDPHNVFNIVAPDFVVNNTTPEYTYRIPHNSLAHADEEWHIDTSKGSCKILTLGDSFTEGDGAPYDSSYPAILEKSLKRDYPFINVMNAGSMGSDPVFNCINLSKRLLKFKPDVVLQEIAEPDILHDFAFRGGFERFVSDSAVRYRKAPVWEPIYAASYVARFFMDHLGMNVSQPFGGVDDDIVFAQSNKILNDLVARYDSLATIHHFRVVYVILPMKGNIQRNGFSFNFSPFIAKVGKTHTASVIALLPMYQNYLNRKGISYQDVYWPVDGHHNSKGYLMMATCIEGYLRNNVLSKYVPDTVDTNQGKLLLR